MPFWDDTASETVTNSRGAKQSKLPVRYDLIPPSSIAKVAEVLAEGERKYGQGNWQLIDTSDHLNHALNHIYLFLNSDNSEDHLSHAACRLLFAIYTFKHEGETH